MATRGEHLVRADRRFATGAGLLGRVAAPGFRRVLDHIHQRLVRGGIEVIKALTPDLDADSFGGTIISQAGDKPNVSALVFISARAPDAGLDLIEDQKGAALPRQLAGELQVGTEGGVEVGKDVAVDRDAVEAARGQLSKLLGIHGRSSRKRVGRTSERATRLPSPASHLAHRARRVLLVSGQKAHRSLQD